MNYGFQAQGQGNVIDVSDRQFNQGQYANNVNMVDLANHTVQMRDQGGNLVTMDLGQADVHIDSTIASYCAGFKLQEGVADIAAPVVNVAHASDKFWTWSQDDTFQLVQDMATTAGGAVKEVSPRLSNQSYQTKGYALQAFIPTELQANADAPLNPLFAAMRRIMNAMLLAREVRVAALMRSASNHANVITATSSTKWNAGASSNPVQDLLTLIEASAQPITDIIMSERTAHAFMMNSAVQKFVAFRQNAPGLARSGDPNGLSEFSAILGLPRIHIASMKFKSGPSQLSYVWGDDVILVHRPGTDIPKDGQDIAPSYTFRWNGGMVGDAQVQGGFVVRSFFNQFRGPRGGQQVVVTVNDAEVSTSAAVSGLIVGAYQ